MVKTKKSSNRFHTTRKSARSLRVIKGGDRPQLGIIKNLNLLDDTVGEYLNPFIGCAYVELGMIDTFYKLFNLPVHDPLLNYENTQHNRLISLVFYPIGSGLVPIHNLVDNTMFPIKQLAQFLVKRYLWTIYPIRMIGTYNSLVKKRSQLKRLVSRLAKKAGEEDTEPYKKLAEQKTRLEELIASNVENITSVFGDKPIEMLINDNLTSYMTPIKQLIPIDTIMNKYSFHILLALLWWKCPTKDHFIEYYTVLKEYLDIFLPEKSFVIPEGFEADKFTHEDAKRDRYEDEYGFFYANFVNYKKNTNEFNINILDFGRSSLNDSPLFTDCGETTIRNIIRMFCVNPDTLRYDISKLERWGAIPKVIEYFTRYNKDDDQYGTVARSDWVAVVSNIEGIEYNLSTETGIRYEMKSNFENSWELMKKLFRGLREYTDLNTEILKIEPFKRYIAGLPEDKQIELKQSLFREHDKTLLFIILRNEIPVYIWIDKGFHSQIKPIRKSFIHKKQEEIPYVYVGKQSTISQYAYNIIMDHMEFANMFGIHTNPYIFAEEEIFAERRILHVSDDETHLIFYRTSPGIHLYSIEDYTLLLCNRNIAYKEFLENAKVHRDKYNRVYFQLYSMFGDTEASPFELDDDGLIYNIPDKSIHYFEFQILEEENLISPSLENLNINFGDRYDEIHYVLNKYPDINEIKCKRLYEPVQFIRSLLIEEFDITYVDNALRYLTTYKLTDGNIPNMLNSLMVIDAEYRELLNIPTLNTLILTNSVYPIMKGMVPDNVKMLILGFSKKVVRSSLISDVLLPDTEINTVFTNDIIYVPDKVEDLILYVSADYDKPIPENALPALRMFSIYTDREDREPFRIQRSSFRSINPKLILYNVVLVD
jgi:hypothetical protein